MTHEDTDTAAPVTAPADAAGTRLEHLERLGNALAGRGFRVRLSAPEERPASLHVTNPEAVALTEYVLAEHGVDGWWFWWSWAERIAAADDVAGAAERVARVLAAHPGH
ncbi:hypothetical protein [Thermomonospora umbrina]|uniref:Uncharacterized protein n=1 Tax=Thermomonospora umbrina TaxID=111806 RepID=A0A3D9SXF3_9ACTN|nr:hypothetical protein [Thermomonospora umbrina]REE99190.1 hypothetical protein DFJ69_4697 [Thermomonospora umbrina]